MYLAVLVLALAQLEQSQRETANLKLMQQLAFPAVPVQEPALPEQFQKSNTANKKDLPVGGSFFALYFPDFNRGEGEQKFISHN